MAEHVSTFLLLTIFMIVAILLIFGMKYFSGARTARLRIDGENTYRDLAARAVAVQEDNAAALSNLNERVSRIETGLSRVEKVLKEVE
ncbi:MAG: hypothetical protein NVV74_03815 [Magnetospirillum sp.]|nr:hypothetical protein [Magnetospirillum sp.]